MVHWTQPNFQAIPENNSHGDSCGVIALLDYLAVAKGKPLTVDEVNTMRTELINMGLMDLPNLPGMTMQQIHAAALHYGIEIVQFVDFNPSLNPAAFRDDLIAAVEKEQYVLVEWANAQSLPDNQHGVQYHFTGTWGIDSNLGYLTANGDTYTALANGDKPVNPVWYGINDFYAAKPVGYIVFAAVATVEGNTEMIIIETDAQGDVTGAHDNTNNLHLGAGMAFAVQQRQLENDSIIRGETYLSNGQSLALLGGNATTLLYTPNHGTDVYEDLNMRNAVETLLNEIDQLKAAPPVPVSTDTDTVVTQAITNHLQEIAALVTAVQNVQASANAIQAAQQSDK